MKFRLVATRSSGQAGALRVAMAMIMLAVIPATMARGVEAQESLKLTVDHPRTQRLLGFATAIYGDVAFAGAPASVTQPGLGYLFDASTGERLHTLEPSVQRDDSLFGFNSRMYGDRLLVGDPANPFLRSKIAGAAYVFDVATGDEIWRLQPEDSFDGDEFGFGIHLHENIALIGAPNLGTGTGAAYLFDISTGQQLQKLEALDPLAGSEFGADVAISQDYAVVGAPANFDTLGFFPGAAYVFDPDTGEQLYKLQPDDSFGGDEFGFDLAVSGHLALIGAPNGGSGKGSAYLFDLNTGEQLLRLQPGDVSAKGDFGAAVDIDEGVIAVGASGLGQVQGVVYLFDAMTGDLLQEFMPNDAEVSDVFGVSLAMQGDRLIVGSPRDDDEAFNSGAAYVFDLVPPPPLLGDFNANHRLDVADLDELSRAVAEDSDDLKYDVNEDGAVNGFDRVVWVDELFGTYFGDANLDGQFSTTDLIQILQAGLYEDNIPNNATWGSGDFDGNLDFDTSDLVVALQTGAYENGPRAAVAAVPEPMTFLPFLTALLMIGRRSRSR